MENAKHIGGISALAVALGIGMAVANTPAVAAAAPGDSGKGSPSGGSSSSSSGSSGSASSDTPSAKRAATNDPPGHHPRALKPRGALNNTVDPDTSTTSDASKPSASTEAATTSAPEDAPGTRARRNGPVTSAPASANTSLKAGPNPLVVDVPTTDATAHPSHLDAVRLAPARRPSFAPATPSASPDPVAAVTAALTPSSAAPAVSPPPPASTAIAPNAADPMSRIVSTLINAVLSPFASSAPTAPVREPATMTLLAFARRDFEQALSMPSTTVNQLAGQITNGLVTGTAGGTSEGAGAVDPDFISSTHNFGLFSVTSAADPDDENFVAFVFESPIFTFVLTSGTDPEDNLGFGAASTGVAGNTVGTLISPFLNFSVAIPVTDPFAELFTELVRLGF
jgi:hypothetical protein